MESKSLHIIQTLAKIGKILSKIIEICCIVGGIMCVVGFVAFLIMGGEDYTIGDVTIHGLIEMNSGETIGTLYEAMLCGFIVCLAESVLCGIAYRYFRFELQEGTPFTLAGAEKMKRLGIHSIWIPLVASVLISSAHAYIVRHFVEVAEFKISMGEGVGMGIAFLILSVIFHYGAEIKAKSEETKEEIPAIEE